jgi:hypothetical protein
MRRDDTHSHPCTRCGTPVECTGERERNYDGFPPGVCVMYHLDGGVLAEILCDPCSDIPKCPDCGSQEWVYKGDRQVCVDCER